MSNTFAARLNRLFDTVYPPENEIDLSKKYKGRKDREIGWQRITSKDGKIMLNEVFRPQENLVVYGACVVNAPKAFTCSKAASEMSARKKLSETTSGSCRTSS